MQHIIRYDFMGFSTVMQSCCRRRILSHELKQKKKKIRSRRKPVKLSSGQRSSVTIYSNNISTDLNTGTGDFRPGVNVTW